MPKRPTELGQKLDWTYDDDIDVELLSNIEIDLLIRKGCKVTINKGFYFENKISGSELFCFLKPIEEEKNR